MLHHRTPLIPSLPLQERVGSPVWLKLESAQPCGSFKLRGMGLRCERAVAAGAQGLVSSSGGNAGYAVAWAGRELGVPVTVIVPETTGARMRSLLEAAGAQVRIHGAAWDDAHAHAIEVAEQTRGALLHPFDHPDIWEGHSTLIDEVIEAGIRPGVVVVAVGGGGLMCGVVEGLQRHGIEAPVLAVETHGAASFHDARVAGGPVTLAAITTLAKTLGAKRVCDRSLELADTHPIEPILVSDRQAVEACARFLDDHRVLVEPSCGAALSLAYDAHPSLQDRGPVLVVVCGGAAVTARQLEDWLNRL